MRAANQKVEAKNTRPRWWLWGLLIAAAIAVFLSPLASPWPDGLEKVAQARGFLHFAEGKQVLPAPLPDYSLPGIPNKSLSTAAAGLLGTIAAFGLALGVGRLLAKKKRKAGDAP
jgi:cobalt/nickel transport protein